MYGYLLELFGEIVFSIFSSIRRVAYLAIGSVALFASAITTGDEHLIAQVCGWLLISGVFIEVIIEGFLGDGA